MTAPCAAFAHRQFDSLPVPESVAILGLGPSLEYYVDTAKRLGARHAMFDEIWGINSAIDVIRCDRGFHMDDIRVQEARAELFDEQQKLAIETLNGGAAESLPEDELIELRTTAMSHNSVGSMLPWLRKHPGPIYTSVPHPEYSGMVAYPLADVMNSCGRVAYFNSTAAYAVAFAVHIGVKKLYLFGCDFTYANAHQSEQGRACVEFYLGMGKARGMVIGLPPTSLMDGVATNKTRLYGYDGMDVSFIEKENEPLQVVMTPCDLPSADAIEMRYDHSQHPNPLLRAAE